MTKLEEIEETFKDEDISSSQTEWLINRVKELQKSLSDLVKSDIVKSTQFITYSEAYLNACKALVD